MSVSPDWSWVPVGGQGARLVEPQAPREGMSCLPGGGQQISQGLKCLPALDSPLFYSDCPTEGSRGQGWKTNCSPARSHFLPVPAKLVRSLLWRQANPFSVRLGPRTSSSPSVEQGAHSLRHVPPRESFVEFSNEMQGNRRDWSFPPGTGFM